ncbi:hypothetical protein HPB52_007984 [Rhipicephalus sanguineus]|uniref:Uncharacterized protein n=1 Tax=Rhipicephalus sanguineus TaxID=34632 RepID=A0A9D4T327_RHISA|nr:hypothetical protein HPB52_007984 [Rhipicephalus sanguineus]
MLILISRSLKTPKCNMDKVPGHSRDRSSLHSYRGRTGKTGNASKDRLDANAPKTGKGQLTDWSAYRKELDDDSTIEDSDTWLKRIAGVLDDHIKIQLDENKPAVDNHLLHLRQARRPLLKRWRRQKLNR